MEKTPQKCRERDDSSLVRLSLKNEDYFFYLMERYENRLLNFITKISHINRDEAEDVLQEVFIKVFRNLASFDKSLSFSAWIYRITRNETFSHFRKNKVYYNGLGAEENEKLLNRLKSELDLAGELDYKFLKENIDKVLKRLDNKYREVLVLKYLEGKDYKEIADILKKPLGTVATLLKRGRNNFWEQARDMKMKF